MEGRVVIYVAGNPDAYPLEYYDRESETYQGLIPQLLRQFSNQSGYEVLYYPTDGADRREHLAKNLQVDILSGYREGDELPNHEEQAILFHTTYEGQEQTYFLCLTQCAPESLKAELETFFASVSQEEISGILMETEARPEHREALYLTIGGLALGVLLLLVLLLSMARRYRKRLRKVEEGGETDAVTGLGNFDYFMRYYRQMVNDKNRILYHLIYFYVDTERLLRLCGNQETENFLRYCAVVLQEYASDTDILAKVSDQGFAMLKFSGNAQITQEHIKPVFERVRDYTQVYEKSFDVGIWAGLYPLKAGDRDMNEMLFHASEGAHMAARSGMDCVVCTGDMKRKVAEERSLQESVDRALESHAFALYLQFYVDAQNFRIIGGEALSRWQHPQRGLLTPDVFIPLLEREGIIYKLDYYCLQASCAFLSDLVKTGVDRFFISCNFSRETFAMPDFADRCIEIMESYQFPRELLIFELTESVSETHAAQIARNMAALKECGVRLALDDFGEGFTSFSDLQQYPVDGIKLDKRLIDNVMTKNGNAIVRAMVQVGHELGLTILAEGVERDDQVRTLQEIHCDVIQGYQFYMPMPEQEAKERLLEQYLRV